MSKNIDVVRLRPFQYNHVVDNNTGISRLLRGPDTYTRLDNEAVLFNDPQTYVIVGPTEYCVVLNPIIRKANGEPEVDKYGQVRVRLGSQEVRLGTQKDGKLTEPFPLYPGEQLSGEGVKQMQILTALEANHVRALENFTDDTGKARVAGDEWLVYGPCTYTPKVECAVVQTIVATTVAQRQALKLRAKNDFVDQKGAKRVAGEEWLWEEAGAFIPGVDESIVEVVDTRVLTEHKALHIQAVNVFTDRFGRKRSTGEQWLLTNEMCAEFMPTPNEKVVREVARTRVQAQEYVVVLNPADGNGVPQLGEKELRKGVAQFFLHPGEELEGGKVKTAFLLHEDEGLVLFALEAHTDADGVARKAGDRWMIDGPREYVPPVQVRTEGIRRAIPLDANEGVYIRDTLSGQIRAHVGSTVKLNEHEALWEKPLDPLTEQLLQMPRLTKVMTDSSAAAAQLPQRIKHKVVTCNVPHNSYVQIYDFRRKQARVVKGPSLVWLQPDEEFTIVSLSGSKPKRGDQIKTLCIHTGPDFMTDILAVETSDHARLQLQLSYNWEFDVSRPDLAKVIFGVRDFVGDACKAIASRIRGAVAQESFDSFHLHSATIIRRAVFGVDPETQQPNDKMVFDNNGLTITNVDIHSVDPTDPKTREALLKSVQLAIEITTKAQESTARHMATALEYEAKGRLEQQIVRDKGEAEKTRKLLLEIEAENAAIESAGASKAAAKATMDAKLIEGGTDVDLAQKRSDVLRISTEAELSQLKAHREAEVAHRRAMNKLYTDKARKLSEIESNKFKKMIDSIGRDTIMALSRAGPELQAQMLKSLGLQGYLVTDGTNPINLFNAAKGFTQQGAVQAAAAQ